jgi:hypothetical protein
MMRCVLWVQVVNALEVWAQPIRDAALRTAEVDGAAQAGNGQVMGDGAAEAAR